MERISQEEAVALIQEFQNGDEKAFVKVHQQFERLALHYVEKRLGSSGYKHLRPDLEDDVYWMLWNAAKKFDPTKGYQFPAYLKQCVNNAISRQIKNHRAESKHLEKYCREVPIKFVDPNSDGNYEIAVTDRFPHFRESILSELTSLCQRKSESAIIDLVCSADEVWHRSGALNNAALARRLGISREAVRRVIANLRTNRRLRSAICELIPR